MEEDVVVMSRQAFQQRRARVQKQLQEITTIREAPKKQEEGGEEEENKYNYRALLAEGHSLCRSCACKNICEESSASVCCKNLETCTKVHVLLRQQQ